MEDSRIFSEKSDGVTFFGIEIRLTCRIQINKTSRSDCKRKQKESFI